MTLARTAVAACLAAGVSGIGGAGTLLETGVVRAAFPAGLDPHEVEVSPDGRWAVVSMFQ